MVSRYRVRVVVCATGERLPLLLSAGDGSPLFLPNVFAVSQVRGASRAANSIETYLRSIVVLLTFAERAGIDIERRVRTGAFLTLGEMDRLAEAAFFPVDQTPAPRKRPAHAKARRPASLESYRARFQTGPGPRAVSRNTIATRLRQIGSFLQWLSDRRAGELAPNVARRAEYRTEATSFLAALKARIPKNHKSQSSREGLSASALKTLFSVVEPGSPRNPWRSEAAQIRNQLLVLLHVLLGPRRGELLAARVADFDFRQNRFQIVRRPDAPGDPRRRQPLVKTSGRVLEVDDAVMGLTQNYVLGVRRTLPAARKHPFLFVEVRTGRPLSHSAFTKVFGSLQAHPELPKQMTAHVLRHTWNDHFSEVMSAHAVRDADEEKFRSYLQGWSEGTGTAATYTKRHVRERARVASLALQAALLKRLSHRSTRRPDDCP